jgi:hypothetical protein
LIGYIRARKKRESMVILGTTANIKLRIVLCGRNLLKTRGNMNGGERETQMNILVLVPPKGGEAGMFLKVYTRDPALGRVAEWRAVRSPHSAESGQKFKNSEIQKPCFKWRVCVCRGIGGFERGKT